MPISTPRTHRDEGSVETRHRPNDIGREKPHYVPWSFRFTHETTMKLHAHGDINWKHELGNHFKELGSDIGFFNDLGHNQFRDLFGVVWDRMVEKNIGIPEEVVLSRLLSKDISFPIIWIPDSYKTSRARFPHVLTNSGSFVLAFPSTSEPSLFVVLRIS